LQQVYVSILYIIQHCFTLLPLSDFTVREAAGIEPKAIADFALTVKAVKN
jgi:hypothetical protein